MVRAIHQLRMGCAWQRGSQDLRAGTSRLRLNSWLKLLTPRPQLLPLSGSWIYVFTLILLPFCRSRPLSVCLFSMTLCPPGFCLFSPHFAPYFYPPAFLYPSALLLPPTHLGLALQAGLQIPPSLPQVSVCGPQAASVSGGLCGRRSPVGHPLQQSRSPAGCLLNNPNVGGSAQRQASTPCSQPAHTQKHTRRPLTNTRAHAVSPAHP